MSETTVAPTVEPKSPRIPGVLDTGSIPGIETHLPDPEPDDGRTSLERLRAQMTAEIESAKKTPQRGPDGRFLPADGTVEGTAAPAQESAPQTEAEREGLPQEIAALVPEKFKFAGEEFDSQTAAEEKYKTVRGMIRASDRRVKEALDVARQYEEAALRAQQTQQTEAQQQAQGFVEALGKEGWEQYESLRSDKGEAFANAWLTDRMDKHVQSLLESRDKDIEKRFLERYPFIEQYNQNLETINNVSGLWQEFSGLHDEDGNATFPELHPAFHGNDQEKHVQFIQEVGSIWKELVERAPQTIRDPYWFAVALDRYRTLKANGPGQSGGSDKSDILLARAQQRVASNVVDEGQPLRQAPQLTPQREFEKSLTSGQSLKHKWGFDPNS